MYCEKLLIFLNIFYKIFGFFVFFNEYGVMVFRGIFSLYILYLGMLVNIFVSLYLNMFCFKNIFLLKLRGL